MNLTPARRFILSCAVLLWPAGSAVAVDFGREIQPILSENCFHCHGQDNQARMAGLRLDVEADAVANRDGRRALVPGDPESSGMFQRITSDNDALRMPPVYSDRRLTPDQIELIERWIREGGRYQDHWSFVPPSKAELPEAAQDAWSANPIDAFVLDRLRQEGLAPEPEAAPSAWLRRASLDLIGLPPTMEEYRAFRRDVETRGETAYEAAVERFLASPRYGERMAIDWLDAARYADTHGFNNDSSREMWRWRDWVIESFNSNKPYDEFIVEQLAGDLLTNPTLDQLIATGFNRNHVINSEGGIIDEEYRVEYVVDRVRTLGMTWLGLSIECARCHDHKYDSLTQKDFYRLFAFFNNVAEIGEDGRVANAVPLIPAPTAEQRQRIARLRDEVADSSTQLERLFAKAKPKSPRAFDASAPDGAIWKIEAGAPNDAEIKRPKFKLEKGGAFTVGLWFEAAWTQPDAPLFSAIDYSPDPASAQHGTGVELRLIGEEVELRFSRRFPAYSIIVRSAGASIAPGERRHIAAVYEGSEGKSSMRARAEWIRVYVDGREVETEIVSDDLQLPAPNFEEIARLGWDNSTKKRRFQGEIGEVLVWDRPLEPREVLDWHHADAVPAAVAAGEPTIRQLRLLTSISDSKIRKQLADLEALRARLFAELRSQPTTMVMREMEQPREAHVLNRGMYDQPGDKVEAGVPEALLGSWPEGLPKNRLGLAKWLTKPDHPLTARVVVNRFWQQFFGVGIVKTSENFGLQGDAPSHPELLDWLARDFVDQGWDVKRLVRQIVLSAAYRQDSASSAEKISHDPENRLVSRGPRFRLPAEILRDQALELAGLLKHRLGGPSVRPYQPEGLYNGVVVGAAYPGTTWEQSEGDDLYRRSLYTFWKRTLPHPAMTVFDAPDREFCTVRRSTTNTPLQALTLLNDETFVEASRRLAERMIREGGASDAERVAWAFDLSAGRAPDAQEAAVLTRVLAKMLASYRADADAARELVSVGASKANAEIPADVLAAYCAVASMILNLDEVVTKG